MQSLMKEFSSLFMKDGLGRFSQFNNCGGRKDVAQLKAMLKMADSLEQIADDLHEIHAYFFQEKRWEVSSGDDPEKRVAASTDMRKALREIANDIHDLHADHFGAKGGEEA